MNRASPDLSGRTFEISDERPERDPEWVRLPRALWADLDHCPKVVVTWNELAQANDPETMTEIAQLAVGEETTLGMNDPIRRIT